MRNNIDCFPDRKEAKERTQWKIEETFWKQIKKEINNIIIKAVESRRYKVVLDKSYNKYYKLIKEYYQKGKRYKVTKIYGEHFLEDIWIGIEIKWN